MKEFKFKVTQTDVFITEITVKAENEQEAFELANKDINECPIDTRSNTLDSSNTDIDLIND